MKKLRRTIDRFGNCEQIQRMSATTDESPVIPGLEKETPEQQIRINLERAMFKYRGNLELYLEKLMERVPEPADASLAGLATHGVVRRRSHR